MTRNADWLRTNNKNRNLSYCNWTAKYGRLNTATGHRNFFYVCLRHVIYFYVVCVILTQDSLYVKRNVTYGRYRLCRWLTLSDESLISVEQDVAALNNHSLNWQVLANVFCFANFVMHHLPQRTVNRTANMQQKQPLWSTIVICITYINVKLECVNSMLMHQNS